ncbi:MAG TPA: UBP-type zinc finger domain-containing protein [Solirubrobacteraceae bacterium]|nr:UBP-type zinc finger domain-containing protein [Solirubrobacteraceae bacterium]
MARCTHIGDVVYRELPEEIAGCEECLKTGATWVHLRMCQMCGKVGCCDSSPNRHASRHAREEEHPVLRSAEPGEEWSWCAIDEVAFVLPAG